MGPSGDPAPTAPLPTFGPCLLWPNGRTSQQLLSFCYSVHICRLMCKSANYCGSLCADGTPRPPTDLVAWLINSRTVSLHWKQPPVDSGSPIVAYSVHYHSSRSGELQKVVRNTSITLHQLTPFTNYTFFIKAYNTRSVSGASSPVSLFTGDDGTLTVFSYLPTSALMVIFQVNLGPFPSGRRHLSCDDCLEIRRKISQMHIPV